MLRNEEHSIRKTSSPPILDLIVHQAILRRALTCLSELDWLVDVFRQFSLEFSRDLNR